MDNDIIATNTSDSFTNRVTELNMRSINKRLNQLFKDCALMYSRLSGDTLFGKTQIRQIQDGLIAVEHQKGRMVVNNDIDKFKFLIDHREQVGKAIGIDPSEIWSNKRILGKVNEYLVKMGTKYDLGSPDRRMKLYISKVDDNSSSLDYQQNWADYIMTQDWIDQLVDVVLNGQSVESIQQDHNLEHLADRIDGMVKDHEIDYHSSLENFNADEFLDSGESNRYINAIDKLNSFDQLNYCFYEMFKPIGGKTTEKYIKVRVFTNGEMEVSGVVGLDDCEHLEWEYGSRDYLRSLNTGNQRYRLRLDMPFNDASSTLWWKPDQPEEFDPPVDPDYDPDLYETDRSGEYEEQQSEEEGDDEEEQGADEEEEEQKHYKYYKEYETERFLRWFGSSHIPQIDADSISKMSVCQSPKLDGDVDNEDFYEDSRNLNTIDLAKTNIDESTSLSLLNMSQRASISIETEKEQDGSEEQYVQFIVGGHQQTSILSFCIRGKMKQNVQEKNHYAATIDRLRGLYASLLTEVNYLVITYMMNPKLDAAWKKANPGKPWVEDIWIQVLDQMESLVFSHNAIDLLRLRQIDLESIFVAEPLPSLPDGGIVRQTEIRHEFLQNSEFYNADLYNYFYNFNALTGEERAELKAKINGPWELMDEATQKMVDMNVIDQDIKYNGITPQELGERIRTYNNLIVRLPVDTYRNQITSLHIFLDWKAFVDNSIDYLVENNFLTKGEREEGMGTDGKKHSYYEYTYVDDLGNRVPLVDYSYCYEYDEQGEKIVIHDRFDYWDEEDFI